VTSTPPATLIVASPGLATTMQDIGRPGWQRFGVPVSGALDRLALAAANIVAGNPPGTAALECLYTGCVLVAAGATVRCAVAGAGARLEITPAADTAVRHVPALESVTLQRGDRVSVRISGPSITAYLAVEGGFDIAPVMASRSTYTRARLGGFSGRKLQTGDHLPLGQANADTRAELRLPGIDLSPRENFRVVLGPQDDHFTPAAIAMLRAATYTVTTAADRMGLRLDGPVLEHVAGADIVSDAIPPGAIQVPGDGQPIIMLADRQTTGGYTKIATVVSADLPALGRIGPGARLRFEIIDVESAEQAARALATEIARWPHQLEPCKPSVAELQQALMRNNLVSGVHDATRMCPQPALNV
jgi:biotin-dependent carboxylase-like uncharacterized protein